MLGAARVDQQGGGVAAGRARRYVTAAIGGLLVLPLVVVVGAQGAQNWCQDYRTFSNLELEPSAWPPGVSCSYEVPGEEPVEKFWPINW